MVYDIGAHEGLWSEMCASLFAPKNCFLFEPQREYQDRIRARQSRLGLDWTVVPVALGDAEGKSQLHLTQNLAASSLLPPLGEGGLNSGETKAVATEEVQVMTLDGLAGSKNLPPPDLVKIDVQGFEWRVLVGGKETLSKARRMIVEVSLARIYEGQPVLPEILQLLTSWGFELEDISETLRAWPSGRLWQVDLWLVRPQ